jgi:uncharacterized membrane protein
MNNTRVFRLILLVTLLKPFSNVFLAWGMHDIPSMVTAHPVYLLRALIDPFVIAGVAMQIVWLLLRLSLLSVADLSFVLPVTAAGYIVTTFLGKVLLHEAVSLERWAGVLLIAIGTAAVAVTPRMTSQSSEADG